MANELILEEKIEAKTYEDQSTADEIPRLALPRRVFDAEISYTDTNNQITIHGLNRPCNGKNESTSCCGDAPCPCTSAEASPLQKLGLTFTSLTTTNPQSPATFTSKIENSTFATTIQVAPTTTEPNENDFSDLPKLHLQAEWKSDTTETIEPWFGDHKETLTRLLALDACKKKTFEKSAQATISYAFSGPINDNDPYPIVAKAVDQAIRTLVAQGVDPSSLWMDSNVLWTNPIYDPEENPKGKFRLAQLVRAMMGIYETAQDFGIPNPFNLDRNPNAAQFHDETQPSAVAITAFGPTTEHTPKTLEPTDRIYVLGTTWPELGETQWAALSGQKGSVPEVDPYMGRLINQALHKAHKLGYVKQAAAPAEGGLAVAFAKMGLEANVGMTIDLCRVPFQQCEQNGEVLYSETPTRFIVAVSPAHAGKFEGLFDGLPCDPVGEVIADPQLVIRGIRGRAIIEAPLEDM